MPGHDREKESGWVDQEWEGSLQETRHAAARAGSGR